MMLPRRLIHDIRRSDGDLVALTVQVSRRQHAYLEALAVREGRPLAAILRALVEEVMGPDLTGEADRPLDEDPPLDHADDAEGRPITLRAHHRYALTAIAEQRGLPLSDLLSQIVGAWLAAHMADTD
jgi:hypothetical protein